MKNFSHKHYTLKQSDKGGLTLEIKDFELFDYLEDRLIEDLDLEYEYYSNKGDVHIMYFPRKYDFEILRSWLESLKEEDIDEIVNFNG